MRVSLARGAIAPGRKSLAAIAHQSAGTSRRVEPGTLTLEEMRDIVIEIRG